MFKVNYNIRKGKYSNLDDVDDMFLRYDFLEGNVMLNSDRASINIDWDIPLLDFAVSMRIISFKLNAKNECDQSFDFTESAAEIRFKRTENDLTISTTFSDEMIKTKYDEFANAVETFYNEVTNKISVEYPELITNKSYQKILMLP